MFYQNITKFIRFLVFSILIIAIPVNSAAGDYKQKSHRHYSFQGTWDSSIDFFGTEFRAMYSFHRGGTLTESDNPAFDPSFGGDALSPGLGVWKRYSKNKIKGKYQKFAYTVDGQLNLVYQSNLLLKLNNRNEWEGTLSIDISTPDGTSVNQFKNLPIKATRLTLNFD